MSLILEALKKVERERQVPDRGFLVLAVPEGARRSGAGPILLVGILALGAGAGAAFVFNQRPSTAPAPAPTAAALPRPLATPPTAAAWTTRSSAPSVRAVGTAVAGISPVGTAPANAAPSPAPLAVSASVAAPVLGSPAAGASPTGRRFVLSAISEQEGRPVAILNDRLVQEGDLVDGVRIVRIGSTEIEIEVDGRRQVVGF